MRKYAREVALCLTFQYMFNNTKSDDLEFFDQTKLTDDDKEFVFNLYNGAIDNLETYKEKVSAYSKGFSLQRIYKVDLAILVLAMYEMQVIKTPVPICINEALLLADKYSTDKSPSYINGILAEFVKSESSTVTLK